MKPGRFGWATMAGVTTDGDIEFLDGSVARVGGAGEAEGVAVAATSPMRWLALAAVLAGGVWFTTPLGSEPVEEQPPITAPVVDPPPADEVAQDPTDRVAVVAPIYGEWPAPRDGDPSVIFTAAPSPLPQEFSAFSLESTTVVYVNAAGRPTVLSFGTGDVSEVNVAATRVHETFVVRAGQVVPMGTDAESGITFHTYRDVDQPGVGAMAETSGAGYQLELCLSGEACVRPGRGLERVSEAGLVAERFDPLRHPQLRDLLTSWALVDDSLVSPDGYRMPAPTGLIWVIGPTEGGSVSSSGLS